MRPSRASASGDEDTKPSGDAGGESFLPAAEVDDEVRKSLIKAWLLEDPDLRPHIGRFVVLGKLGEGGMGSVYSAYDEELDRKVAIKLVLERHLDDPRSRKRMRREARALARLSHPNVVQVFEVGEHEGQIFVAMEFVRGSTLLEWQRAAARSVREILAMYVEIGRGLQAAHEAGLVHRDLKPANVIVGEDGRPRIIDFGLVQAGRAPESPSSAHWERASVEATAPVTEAKGMLGTPAYMAPEQMKGDEVDARADQFSFCVALHEALLGARPFAGTSRGEVVRNVLAGRRVEAPSAGRVPARVRRAVLRGLSTEPSERYPSMDALIHELDRDRRAWLSRVALGVAGLTVVGTAATLAYLGTRPGTLEVHWTGAPVDGAEVVVGDRMLELTEGGAQGELAAGLYPVTVRIPDYVEQTKAVEIRRGGFHRVDLVMQHERGRFSLDVEPAGATILVDGKDYGSRLAGIEVDTGAHEILVRREGHHEARMRWEARTDAEHRGYAYLPVATVWSDVTSLGYDPAWAGDANGDGRSEIIYHSRGMVVVADPWRGRRQLEIPLASHTGRRDVFVDADGDGVLDLVAMTDDEDGKRTLVEAFSGRGSGRATPLWSVELPEIEGPLFAPLPLDVDGDGIDEIVLGGPWRPSLAVRSAETGELWWTLELDGPVLGRVAGTHEGEPMLFVATETTVSQVRMRDGTVRWSVPQVLRRTPPRSRRGLKDESGAMATAQIDGRPGDDLLLPVAVDGSDDEVRLRALAGSDGSEAWTGPVYDLGLELSNRLGDVDGDGTSEIVLLHEDEAASARHMVLVDGETGTPRWTHEGSVRSGGMVPWRGARPWSNGPSVVRVHDSATGEVDIEVPLDSIGHPRAADWDGDGTEELLLSGTDGTVLALAADGTHVGSAFVGETSRAMVAGEDANADGVPDLLLDARGSVVIAGPRIRWRHRARMPMRAPPTVVDVDGNGDLEVAMVNHFERGFGLRILDAATGQIVFDEEEQVSLGHPIRAAAVVHAAAGEPWLVFSAGPLGLRIHDGQGRRHGPTDFPALYVTPLVLDAGREEDAAMVVVTDGPRGELVSLDPRSWERRWALPVPSGGSLAAPIAVDVDGDDHEEVIVATGGGVLIAVDPRAPAARWETELGEVFRRAPVHTMVDGEAVLVVAVDDEVAIVGARDGEVRLRLPTASHVNARPALHDVDGDGTLEVLTGGEAGLAAWRVTGEIVWRSDPRLGSEGEPVEATSPLVLADLDRDGRPELLAGMADGGLHVVDPGTGRRRWQLHAEGGPIEAPPLVVDVDGDDGPPEVLLASHDRSVYCVGGR